MPLPIALDHRPALLQTSGIGRACRELARALGERGDLDVHLFGHSLARCRAAALPLPGTALHRLPIPGRSLPWLARLGLGADRLAGRARVFHCLDYVQPPVSRARTVLTVHDLAFARDATWHGDDAPVLAARTRDAIARAHAVIVPSAATATDLRTFAPGARTVHIVPFGGDHVPTTPRPHPMPGRTFALCLGTIEPRKDHVTLLRAWQRLPAPRPLLVVVGRIGWACDAAVAALRAAVAAGDAEWRRGAGDDEVWALLQHAELLVYPSLWEGFGFPPLEAMRLGTPVVTSDAAPLVELAAGAAVHAPAGDADALARAIARVLQDEALRAELRDRGRRRAAVFSWRACAAAHAAIYHEVAQ